MDFVSIKTSDFNQQSGFNLNEQFNQQSGGLNFDSEFNEESNYGSKEEYSETPSGIS